MAPTYKINYVNIPLNNVEIDFQLGEISVWKCNLNYVACQRDYVACWYSYVEYKYNMLHVELIYLAFRSMLYHANMTQNAIEICFKWILHVYNAMKWTSSATNVYTGRRL